MANFRTYLSEAGLSLGDFAKRIHISKSFMSEIASGKKIPLLALAKDISIETGGAISVTHWVDADGPAAALGNSRSSHIANASEKVNQEEPNHA